MSRSNGMLAFVTGLGGGYLTARDRKLHLDARAADQTWKAEERQRQRREWERSDAVDGAVRDAAAPVEAKDATVYQPANDDEGNAMPANPTEGRMSVQGTHFSDPAEAEKAVAAANAPRARMGRVADAYASAGRIDKAEAVRTSVRQGEVADLQAKQLTEADDRDRKMREAGGLLARGGWAAVPTLYDRYDDGLSARVVEDGKGGATVITIDKDGKEVGKQAYRDLPHLFQTVAGQFDLKLWLDGEKDRRREDRELAKDQVDADYKAGSLDVARQNAATNEAYRKDMGTAATTRAENSAKDPFAKMPEAEKLSFQSINRQIETIQTEIVKAQAGGMADPTAIAQLRQQAAGLQIRQRQLLEKYQPTQARPDPLGLRKPSAGGAGGEKVDPKEQAARDKDRVGIITAELDAARKQVGETADPTARARVIADVAALERELAGLKREQPARQASARMSAAVPAQAAPAAPVAAPAAPVAAAVPPEVLEARLVQEMTLMGEGKLMRHSPEVQQYLAAKQAQQQQAAQAQLATRQQAEFQRARMGGL